MDKQQLAEKAEQALKPFETGNLVTTIQTMSVDQLYSHPVPLLVLLAVLIFGIVKRSKTILLTLFVLLGLVLITRYAMPGQGQELTMGSIMPFLGFGMVIMGVVVYFTMIHSD